MRHTRTGAFSQYRLSSLHRNVTPIALAAAILARYGCSLWVADPAYTFTGSDGTGAAGDNSDVGHVRDLCGNARPLTQATTGFKPKLKRVPKKLGPELVANGDFASATGWSIGANWSISGGVATHGASGVNTLAQALNTTAGRTYAVSWQIAAVTAAGSGISVRIGTGGAGSVLGGVYSAAGNYVDILTPTADQTGFQFITRGAVGDWVGSVDNISMREVLEWGWAWVGDGVDDTLATTAQPTTNAAETMGVAYWHTGANNKASAIHYVNRRDAGANLGMSIYQGAGSPSTSVIAGYGTSSATALVSPTASAGVVVSLQADGDNMRRFLNGVQVGADVANPYSFATNAPIYLMSSQGSANSFCDRPIFAAYWAPVILTPSERLIVERAMAQLGGITI